MYSFWNYSIFMSFCFLVHICDGLDDGRILNINEGRTREKRQKREYGLYTGELEYFHVIRPCNFGCFHIIRLDFNFVST